MNYDYCEVSIIKYNKDLFVEFGLQQNVTWGWGFK